VIPQDIWDRGSSPQRGYMRYKAQAELKRTFYITMKRTKQKALLKRVKAKNVRVMGRFGRKIDENIDFLYVTKSTVDIKKRLHFYEVASEQVNKRFDSVFSEQLDKALKTAR
jgi:hypothetical protein